MRHQKTMPESKKEAASADLLEVIEQSYVVSIRQKSP
jgi:hypothetical protein